MPADMKSVSLFWWSVGLSEIREGAHSKHSSVLTSILCFKTVSDWHPGRNLLWNTRQEGQGPLEFQQGYNPSIAEGPRTSGRAHCPWLQAPGGGKQFSLPPSLPCVPCKTPNSVLAEQAPPGPQGGITAPDCRHQVVGNSSLFLPPCPASPAKHQTLSWQSRLCLWVSVVSRAFFLPTFPLPLVPLVPGPRFCVSLVAPSPHPVPRLRRCGGDFITWPRWGTFKLCLWTWTFNFHIITCHSISFCFWCFCVFFPTI